MSNISKNNLGEWSICYRFIELFYWNDFNFIAKLKTIERDNLYVAVC